MVLFAVGTASPAYVTRHKRLRAYTARDYDLLVTLLSSASEATVTPNTVTEASNLARQIDNPARTDISNVIRLFLHRAVETYSGSSTAAEADVYPRLGITDAALLSREFADHVLLTADLDLYLEAARHGRKVLNLFHHIEANRLG